MLQSIIVSQMAARSNVSGRWQINLNIKIKEQTDQLGYYGDITPFTQNYLLIWSDFF